MLTKTTSFLSSKRLLESETLRSLTCMRRTKSLHKSARSWRCVCLKRKARWSKWWMRPITCLKAPLETQARQWLKTQSIRSSWTCMISLSQSTWTRWRPTHRYQTYLAMCRQKSLRTLSHVLRWHSIPWGTRSQQAELTRPLSSGMSKRCRTSSVLRARVTLSVRLLSPLITCIWWAALLTTGQLCTRCEDR